MKKFPYIKWYQDDNFVYISVLQIKEDKNIILENEKNILKYEDDIYMFSLELCSDFEIYKNLYFKNMYIITLKKNINEEWSHLLKNRNFYKYFISVNWDKYNSVLLSKNQANEENINYDENEFQHLLNTGVLDEISSDEEDTTN